MSSTRFICVHSLTAHGVVGLKAFMPVLGECCLPAPSLLLTGPGDMPGCQRFQVDLAGLLRGSLAAAAARGEAVGLFIGYLADADQLAIIDDAITTFRATIGVIAIDPVCGDNGRACVAPEIIAAWPRLMRHADWLFPNCTEVELLTGARGGPAIAALREKYPRSGLVVTGSAADSGDEIEPRLYHDGLRTVYRQPRIAGRFNGAGDLFSAFFVRALFIDGVPPALALTEAANGVARAAQLAVARSEQDLSLRVES
ncbi:MAG: bifunctional hydroxymethylpyrimidine kinase/phosphomethylpyrimidine kinase [Opitutaceae bacterium]